MGLPIIGDLIREVGATVREFIPDGDKKLEASVKLAELADAADAREDALLQGQISVNVEEAKNSNLFVAGWRPFMGWVGGSALAWTWIGAPVINWVATLFGAHVAMPALSAESIYPVIFGMLGLGTMRTVEKVTGVTADVNGVVNPPVKPSVNPPLLGAATSAVARTVGRWIR